MCRLPAVEIRVIFPLYSPFSSYVAEAKALRGFRTGPEHIVIGVWASDPARFIYIFKDFIYLFLDRGEGREKERETNINVWLPLMCPTLGNLAGNPGTCPDWESNRRPCE